MDRIALLEELELEVSKDDERQVALDWLEKLSKPIKQEGCDICVYCMGAGVNEGALTFDICIQHSYGNSMVPNRGTYICTKHAIEVAKEMDVCLPKTPGKPAKEICDLGEIVDRSNLRSLAAHEDGMTCGCWDDKELSEEERLVEWGGMPNPIPVECYEPATHVMVVRSANPRATLWRQYFCRHHADKAAAMYNLEFISIEPRPRPKKGFEGARA